MFAQEPGKNGRRGHPSSLDYIACVTPASQLTHQWIYMICGHNTSKGPCLAKAPRVNISLLNSATLSSHYKSWRFNEPLVIFYNWSTTRRYLCLATNNRKTSWNLSQFLGFLPSACRRHFPFDDGKNYCFSTCLPTHHNHRSSFVSTQWAAKIPMCISMLLAPTCNNS